MASADVSPEMKEAFRTFAEESLEWDVKDPGIRSLEVLSGTQGRGSDRVWITVGQRLPPGEADSSYDEVLAIFESTAYLVVTWDRGGYQGLPYLYGKDDVLSVET
jgi:hypothetical protein